jgi:predicted DNA-binding protein YlxM (UPF0122 family)
MRRGEGSGVKGKSFEMALLFDFYGEILTDKQKEFFDLYYNEDLSLGEIAENEGITRQGVHDVIHRAELTLTEMEDKLGLVARYGKVDDQFASVSESASEIARLNSLGYSNADIGRCAEKILEIARRFLPDDGKEKSIYGF